MTCKSLSTDSNGPLPGTGRVRRRLRLRGSARRPSHQTAADLQTCDARSAGALLLACCSRGCCPRPVPTASRLIKPALFGTLAPCEARFTRTALRGRSPLQGSESNRRGPAYEAGLGASTRPAKPPGARGGNRTRLAGLEGRCLGQSATRACERSAGVEPAPLTWRASVQPRTPWAQRQEASEPAGTRFTTAHPASSTRRRRRESNSRDRGPAA